MTRPITFTEAGIRRAIKAARRAGLRVKEIRQDGTVVVDDGENPQNDGQDGIEEKREIVL